MKCYTMLSSISVFPPTVTQPLEQPIKDAVITVPCFFNQAERRAVLKVANMAGVKVLQLINDNTAVAINYGVFRRKDIDSTPKVKIRKKNCERANSFTNTTSL